MFLAERQINEILSDLNVTSYRHKLYRFRHEFFWQRNNNKSIHFISGGGGGD